MNSDEFFYKSWFFQASFWSNLEKKTEDTFSSNCCIFQGYGHIALGQEVRRVRDVWDRLLCEFIISIQVIGGRDQVGTRVTRRTDHPLSRSQATEQKAQQVEGKDVAIYLNPFVRTSELSLYRFFVAGYPRIV